MDERAYLKYVGKARARTAQLPVAVGLADEEGFPHQGRLEFVDNRVDAQSGTVRMRALLDNKDGRLAPGLFARVKIGDARTPRKAVLVSRPRHRYRPEQALRAGRDAGTRRSIAR